MANKELYPIQHHEVYTPRGEKLVATYAGRHVREYDSYDPRLVIDILKNGNYFGKIIADNFTGLEWEIGRTLDRVELIRGHHKARLIFAIGQSVLDGEGGIKHEVYSPDGIVGYARGSNLDFYIASLFHDDPKIKEKAQKGGGGFDEAVERYFEHELNFPDLFGK